MPKRVIYIECGCGNGRLEFIGQTGLMPDPAMHEPIDYRTIFYACDKCPKIYRLQKRDSEGVIPENMILYTGKLSKEQINKHIHKVSGYLSKEDEAKILGEITNPDSLKFEYEGTIKRTVIGISVVSDQGLPLELEGERVKIIIIKE